MTTARTRRFRRAANIFARKPMPGMRIVGRARTEYPRCLIEIEATGKEVVRYSKFRMNSHGLPGLKKSHLTMSHADYVVALARGTVIGVWLPTTVDESKEANP